MIDKFLMCRNAARPLSRYFVTQGSQTRHFHQITTDFITQDRTGKLVSKKVPVVLGNPGQAYVLIPPPVGEAFRDASSTAATQDRCRVSFFHDTQHFGLGKALAYLGESYGFNANAYIAEFAERSSATGQYLKPVLDQLEHM
ncbi:uncharacterized protein N7479_003299 [Penicillium vulpinum]|uniref:uncharacterized protein n=1 Tax=Penicillium vulpinum TaxID=29845 RepID=UPI0025487412|nr:uncharacterized protein N7479_003299 [Penicillium vulpinum]KAJ5963423.1 hypothetical protein N7479_003299 [Penicillium vulpinum]